MILADTSILIRHFRNYTDRRKRLALRRLGSAEDAGRDAVDYP